MIRKVLSYIFLLCVVVPISAHAGPISIDAGTSPYSGVPAAQGINVNDMTELRMAAGLALIGMYRTINGVFSVPVNSTVDIKYSDGSKEKFKVVCLAGTVCAQPVPGTQQQPGSGGSGGSGGISPPWNPSLPPPGCYGEGCGVVTVGDLEHP